MSIHCACVALCLALLPPPVAYKVIHVPEDQPTIQQAIDVATPYDTIIVGPGTYHEALTWNAKPLTIRGDLGAKLTVIDGGGAPATIQATWVPGMSLHKVTVTGGVNGLVQDGSGNVSFANHCTFRGNSEHGCVIQSAFLARLTDCVFAENGLGGARIVLSGSLPSLATVDTCAFALGDGLTVEMNGPLPGVNVIHCSFDGGTVTATGGSVGIDSCILRNSTVPVTPSSATVIYSDVQGGWPGVGNIDADPVWADPARGDLTLLPQSPCKDAANPDLISAYVSSSMGAYPYSPLTGLGGEFLLDSESQTLVIYGSLEQGSPITFELIGNGPPTVFYLVIGASALGQPFKGGVLWPHPDLILGPYQAPAQVGFYEILEGDLPTGVPVNSPFWAQLIWPEPAAPFGWAMTAGVKGLLW